MRWRANKPLIWFWLSYVVFVSRQHDHDSRHDHKGWYDHNLPTLDPVRFPGAWKPLICFGLSYVVLESKQHDHDSRHDHNLPTLDPVTFPGRCLNVLTISASYVLTSKDSLVLAISSSVNSDLKQHAIESNWKQYWERENSSLRPDKKTTTQPNKRYLISFLISICLIVFLTV